MRESDRYDKEREERGRVRESERYDKEREERGIVRERESGRYI